MNCKICKKQAVVSLKSHNAAFCADCYLEFFRREVLRGIKKAKLFDKDDRILVALSGGKDSLSLMLELYELGYDVQGLFIDLAIPGNSEVARGFVQNFCGKYNLPLKIVDLAQEGLAIPEVKKYLKRPVCSICGKIKRYFFNKAALAGGFNVLATGHNLDDEVARLFSNTLRWDGAYLSTQGPLLEAEDGFAARVKPLWRLTEFETANYAFLRGIDYYWHGCPYSKGASFSVLKNVMAKLEKAMPGRKIEFYQSFLEKGKPAFATKKIERKLIPCAICGYPTSGEELCGLCRIKKAVQEKKAKYCGSEKI